MLGVKLYWPSRDCCRKGEGEEYSLFPDLMTEFGAGVCSIGRGVRIQLYFTQQSVELDLSV